MELQAADIQKKMLYGQDINIQKTCHVNTSLSVPLSQDSFIIRRELDFQEDQLPSPLFSRDKLSGTPITRRKKS